MLNLKITKSKKGFTLTEVMITITLLLIILGLISPLLNYNLKSLYATENKSDLQREANYFLENFTNRAIQATEIEEISENSTNPNDVGFISCKADSSAKSIKYIKFRRVEQEIDGIEKYYNYIFVYDENTKTVKYGEEDDKINMKVAQNIEEIKVQPISLEKSFSDCKGIKVEVKFSKHLVESYVVTNEVRFRN